MKTFRYVKSITSEQIEDLLSSALQGITYWADDAEIKKVQPKHEGIFNSQAFTYNYSLRIHDAEEDVWHNLTITKLLKGLSLTDNLDFGTYDMHDADRVIQRALFGTAVYA